jgi:hypothetical protein
MKKWKLNAAGRSILDEDGEFLVELPQFLLGATTRELGQKIVNAHNASIVNARNECIEEVANKIEEYSLIGATGVFASRIRALKTS